jgi:hypothetical protein
LEEQPNYQVAHHVRFEPNYQVAHHVRFEQPNYQVAIIGGTAKLRLIAPCWLEFMRHGTVFFFHNKSVSASLSAAETIS